MDRRSRENDNEYNQKLKEAKKIFRRELRTRQKCGKREFEEIAGMEEVDRFKFWRSINRKMGRRQTRATYLQIDEQFIEDEQKLTEYWA